MESKDVFNKPSIGNTSNTYIAKDSITDFTPAKIMGELGRPLRVEEKNDKERKTCTKYYERGIFKVEENIQGDKKTIMGYCELRNGTSFYIKRFFNNKDMDLIKIGIKRSHSKNMITYVYDTQEPNNIKRFKKFISSTDKSGAKYQQSMAKEDILFFSSCFQSMIKSERNLKQKKILLEGENLLREALGESEKK